jgi:P-type Mg2+ transporter
VDVAREAADVVLLQRDLEVLRQGVMLGRTTFVNTLKYLYTTESANFGNMISMAAASLFLPFLPMTAPQILLNNFLSDMPATAIATDAVDPEQIEKPRRWELRTLTKLMLVFGAISSVFDLVTFAVLLRFAHAGPGLFRTGWFVESLLTELAIALVVRTRRPFYRSRPGKGLLGISVAVIAIAVALPYLPASELLGFEPMPGWLVAFVAAITIAYVLAVEAVKRVVFRSDDSSLHTRRSPRARAVDRRPRRCAPRSGE